MDGSRFSKIVSETLRAAGWFPGRRVPTDNWRQRLEADSFRSSEVAVDALAEFGGLQIRQRGAGITMARESIDLDPCLALGERDRFLQFEGLIGRGLFPLGEGGGGHFFIAMSDEGAVFGVADGIVQLGATIEEALTNLILGIRGVAIR